MEFPEAFTFIYTNSQKHNAITESDKIIISGTGYTGESGSEIVFIEIKRELLNVSK